MVLSNPEKKSLDLRALYARYKADSPVGQDDDKVQAAEKYSSADLGQVTDSFAVFLQKLSSMPLSEIKKLKPQSTRSYVNPRVENFIVRHLPISFAPINHSKKISVISSFEYRDDGDPIVEKTYVNFEIIDDPTINSLKETKDKYFSKFGDQSSWNRVKKNRDQYDLASFGFQLELDGPHVHGLSHRNIRSSLRGKGFGSKILKNFEDYLHILAEQKGLPQTNRMTTSMLDTMIWLHKNDYQPATAKDQTNWQAVMNQATADGTPLIMGELRTMYRKDLYDIKGVNAEMVTITWEKKFAPRQNKAEKVRNGTREAIGEIIK